MRSENLKVWLEENHVVFECPPTTYEVPLAQIKTPENLLGWCHHICEKNWPSTIQIRRFIAIVAEQKGWEIHPL